MCQTEYCQNVIKYVENATYIYVSANYSVLNTIQYAKDIGKWEIH